MIPTFHLLKFLKGRNVSFFRIQSQAKVWTKKFKIAEFPPSAPRKISKSRIAPGALVR